MKQLFWAALFIVIGSALLVSCAKTGSTYTTTPVTYVSVMNEAVYGPTTDIYLNDQLATGTAGIAPGNYSLKYGALQPGSYTIKFKKNGSDSVLSTIQGAQTLDTLNFYTLLLYNDVNKAIQSMLIHDDFTSISTTNANFRFFNLSPDAPSVDFYLNSASSATYTNRTPGDNANPSSSYNTFISSPSSSYNLAVKVAGGDSVLATYNSANLVGGNVYTIFLSGKSNNLKLNILQASY